MYKIVTRREGKMKKGKRKNNLKSSLILLLLLVILLVSSTYAWFTANTVVTISTLDVKIEAQNGLQISTDAVKWKSIISTTDITDDAYVGNANQVPEYLEPVSTIGDIDATTGYMKMYKGTVAADEADGGVDKLTATLIEGETAGTTGSYIAFDMFLRVDKETQLQLTDASGVIKKEGSTDKGIKQASRVAFCIQGTRPVGTAETEITALKGATSYLNGEVKTSPQTVYIWEPNSNLHTAAAKAHANSNYEKTDIKIDGTADPIEYYGIKQNITTGLTLVGTNDGTDTTNFSKIEPDYTTKDVMEVTNVFKLNAGITKVRVYMWVEGQDIDCENTASGTDISFNIQLQVAA